MQGLPSQIRQSSRITRIRDIRCLCTSFLAIALIAWFQLSASGQEASELWDAAQRGDVAKIQALLDAGIDANSPTEYNATALMYACGRGHQQAVEVLLEAGADPNNKDRFYNATPMAWAAMKQNKDIALLLVQSGCEDILPAIRLTMLANDIDGTKQIIASEFATPEKLAQAKRFLPESASDELKSLFDDIETPKPNADASVDKPAWTPKPIELDIYVGEYQRGSGSDSEDSKTDPKSRLTISLEDSQLVAKFDGSSIPLLPEQRHEFQLGGRTLRFKIESGLVASLTLDGLDSEQSETWSPVSTMLLNAELRAESRAEDLAISSADWTQFRGPQARGVADGYSLLKEW
ncbi:MAG: ankyrin repeat domain-containing protein, partial [Planctomycetota bacterium]